MALVFAAPAAMATQVFYENFRLCGFDPTPPCVPGPTAGGAGTYSFPSGWLLRNVDNRTPDPQVAYVNEAWEVREDFNFNVSEYAAFSTSYYSPVGQADDWMWTPAIALPASGAVLTWRAVTYDPSYPDGYEVRVMTSPNVPTGGTGAIGNQITNSTVIFSVAAENPAWTSRTVDLAAYVGQTVYVGFRNNSNDKFLLLIDDVTVINSTPDAIAQASMPFASEYSRAPDGFAVDASSLGFNVFNGGGSDLTNVTGTATLEVGGAAAGPALPGSATPSLAIGATAAVTFGTGNQFIGPGTWTVRYVAASDQDATDANLANNEIVAAGPVIGGNEFARTEGSATGVLGIGAGNGGEIGEQFTLSADTTVEGIRFGMGVQPATVDDGTGNQIPNPFLGAPLIANLRGFIPGTPNSPGAVIDTTVPVPATLEGGLYDVAFAGGPHLLTAGTYVVTVSEPATGFAAVAMTLPLHDNRYMPGTAWVNWPTNPFNRWANIEEFGASFAKMPEVSLLTEMSIFKDGFEVPAAGVKGPVKAWRAPARAPAPARPLRKSLPTVLAGH